MFGSVDPHTHIRQLMQKLNYPSDEGGVCAGITEVGVIEFLGGNLEGFSQRIHEMMGITPDDLLLYKLTLEDRNKFWLTTMGLAIDGLR